jgi:signal transduction histidine kinase
MDVSTRLVSFIGEGRTIAALGGLYVALASVFAALLLMTQATLFEVVGRFFMVGVIGAVLIYGGYRLPDMELHPDTYLRVVAWTFGGFGIMVCVVAVMELISPSGVDNPLFAVSLATSLGSIGGFAAGVHDARAKTRERELEETVEQLRASNERLEQFAYAASHDLQEPLRMVSSYLRLLESRYGDDLDEEAEEFIGFAVDGADRMRAMIENLLEYSRVTTRGESPEPTDAEAVVRDVLDDLHLQIEETDATVTVDELPTVTADADQLAQLFRNLLSNALKYSGDEPPEVHVSAERSGDGWQFAVADEGIGIDPEYHDRIFTVFEQLRIEEDERGAGGIGLALCERIVERHGGEIWVESEPGEGTTFYFTIPATGKQRRDPRVNPPAAG